MSEQAEAESCSMPSSLAALDPVLRALESLLIRLAPVRLAVSGGVDSMTLAILAGRVLGPRATMIHAVSPAVPSEATDRVRRVSMCERWNLQLVDAGEFSDESYLSNPYDRCFYCKSNLYRSIMALARGTILSGTNLDDLGDYRPGLQAASDHGVQHPFVVCKADKKTVRALCHYLGYPEIAQLPASPCLASRVETGIRIKAGALSFVHQVEREISEAVQPSIVRCRIRPDSVVVELDAVTFGAVPDGERTIWERRIANLARENGLPTTVRFEPYRRGSAFVQSP